MSSRTVPSTSCNYLLALAPDFSTLLKVRPPGTSAIWTVCWSTPAPVQILPVTPMVRRPAQMRETFRFSFTSPSGASHLAALASKASDRALLVRRQLRRLRLLFARHRRASLEHQSHGNFDTVHRLSHRA
jgi:hypothetical protein